MTSRSLSFPILGRPFEASNVPSRFEAWLREQWEFTGPNATADYAIHLEFVASDRAPPVPNGATRRDARVPGITVPGAELDGEWWLGDARSGVHLKLSRDGAVLRAWTDESGPLGPALYVAICEGVRESGLVPLHGAVALREEKATLFVGASVAGKSTTLLQAVRAGWTAVAEDFSWLDPDTLRVHGWDRGLHLWPEGQARFAPDLDRALWRHGSDGKLFLAFEALGREPAREGTLVRLALLDREAGRPSGWERLGERDAVRALWEAQGVGLSPAARARGSRVVPSLLSRLELTRLVLGTTPLPL